MPHLKFARPAAPVDPRLVRLLWQWLIVGVVLCTLLPAARAYNHWIGCLPGGESAQAVIISLLV